MRSAAVLLSSHRRGMRRVTRHLPRTRLRQRPRGGVHERAAKTRFERPEGRPQSARSTKRRPRMVHAMPRGFLPLVRH